MSDDFYWELADANPDAAVWDEYREAYLGIAYKNGMKPVAVYDKRLLQGLLVEELLSDEKYMDDITKVYGDNEEAITQQVIKDSIRTFTEKVLMDKSGEGENGPIFLDIPYFDSRFEMMEEE
mgnify:CR=1 FL=1|tara:strand:- start:207 stop:572 length:366 start_codon:yes stop_codon:yes gene_type:complete